MRAAKGRTVDANENVTQFTTDRFGRVRSSTDALGNTTFVQRNDDGRVTAITRPDPDGDGPLRHQVTRFTYDDRGNLVQTTLPDGAIRSWTYDDTFSQVTSFTDELGRQTLFDIDPANGNLRSETQIVGLDDRTSGESDDVTQSFTYTHGIPGVPDGLISTIVDPLGRITRLQYYDSGLDAGRLRNEILAEGTSDVEIISYEYDAAGNQTAVVDGLGRRTEFTYDEMNRVVGVMGPDPDGAGPQVAPFTSYAYDSEGNLIATTDPLGNSTSYVYDSRDRLISNGAARSGRFRTIGKSSGTLSYDDQGNVASATDEIGHTETYVYDKLNRLVATIHSDPDGAGPLPSSIESRTYDAIGNIASVTDELGNTTQFRYDDRNRLVETILPDPDDSGPLSSPVMSSVFDVAGQLIQSVDPIGRITQYVYDDLGRITTVILPDPDGAGPALTPVQTATYDKASRVINTTDELGNTTTFVYDDRDRQTLTILPDPDGSGPQSSPEVRSVDDTFGQLLSIEDALGNVTSFEYDDLGRAISVTQPDPDGVGTLSSPVILSEYDLVGNLIATIDPLGNRTDFIYDNLYRNIQTTAADPDGPGPASRPVFTFAYDAAGQLLSKTDALGRTTIFESDGRRRLVRQADPDPDGAGPAASPVWVFSYDVVGNLLGTSDPLGDVQSNEYDNLYRVIRTIAPDPDGNGPLTAPTTSLSYDNANQLISVSDPLGRVTLFAYDDLGRQIRQTAPDPDGSGPQVSPVTDTSYDLVGNVTAVTDALGNGFTFAYDNLYRRTSETDANADTTLYGYDAHGNLVSLTDPVTNETTWTYDVLHRVIREENQLGDARTFAYDAAGNLIIQTDRNGRITEYEFDNLHRMVEERWLTSGSVERTTSFAYDLVGQLTGVQDPSAAYTFVYDDLGRVTSESQNVTGLAPEIVFASVYDADSRRTSLSATIDGSSDFTNAYQYDSLDRLTNLMQTSQVVGNSVATKRISFEFDAASQWTTIARFADIAETQLVAETNYAFDLASRLTGLSHQRNGTTLADYGWSFDEASRVTQFTSSADGVADYSYDDRNQITAANYDFQSNELYSYDDNGNPTNVGYVTGTNNQLQSDGVLNYAYDAEGNRTKRTNIATGEVTDYTWDHRNRLVRVVTRASEGSAAIRVVTKQYDAQNQWVGQSVDADGDGPGIAADRFFAYHDGQISLQFDGTAASDLSHRYLWGPGTDQLIADEVVSSLAAEGDVHWALSDNLGSVRDIVEYDDVADQTTNINHLTYDSFGNLRQQTNAAVDMLFGYTGRPFDKETGLQNNLHRWYDPAVGRWTSEDPIGFEGGDANLVRYVGNKPTSFTDPAGLLEIKSESEAKKIIEQQLKVWEAEGSNYAVNLMRHFLKGGALAGPFTPSASDKAEVIAHAGDLIHRQIDRFINEKKPPSHIKFKHKPGQVKVMIAPAGDKANIRFFPSSYGFFPTDVDFIARTSGLDFVATKGFDDNMFRAFGGAQLRVSGTATVTEKSKLLGLFFDRTWSGKFDINLRDYYVFKVGGFKQWLSTGLSDAYEAALWLETNCPEKYQPFRHSMDLRVYAAKTITVFAESKSN